MLINDNNTFDKDIHKIQKLSISSESLDGVRKLHNDFYNRLSDVCDLLLKSYGDVWLLDSSTTARDFIDNGGRKTSLYKKLCFLLEDISTYNNKILDKETGLIPSYTVINTSKGLVVIRDSQFFITPIILFPFSLKLEDGAERKMGLIIEEKSAGEDTIYGTEYVVNQLFNNDLNGRILFSIDSMMKNKEKNGAETILFRFKFCTKVITDDLGKSFYNFTNKPTTSFNEISEDVKNTSYTLVGTNYYAPLTTGDEVDCILYAELDNQYDDQAIKILRWIPCPKDSSKADTHAVHEYGHVSRGENSELHEEMCKSNNRILFGKVKDNEIRIVGNLQSFLKKGTYSSYWLPKQLFKLIAK